MGRPPKKKPRLDHEAIDLLPVPLQQREFAHRIIVVLYAAAAPVAREVLAALVPDHCNFDELLAAAEETLRALPLEIAKVAGGYTMRTRRQYGSIIRASGVAASSTAPSLTKAQLEVAVAIAYGQPITHKELSERRGADCHTALEALWKAGLIAYGPRRRDLPGAPPTYVTRKEFLVLFQLASLDDLPRLEDFEILNDRRSLPAELYEASDTDPGDRDDGSDADDGREEVGADDVGVSSAGQVP